VNDQPIIYGAAYSVYVKIVRLALLEKSVDYTLEPIDIFASEGVPKPHLKRHPFSKIPAFSHCGLEIYETSAIVEYIDCQFPKPSLMPSTVADRAKARQIISIFDNYAYQSMVWGIYVASQDVQSENMARSELQKHINIAENVMKAVSELVSKEQPFFMGETIMLPDLYAAPMIDYFNKTDIGKEIVKKHGRMQQWWDLIHRRTDYEAILKHSD